jgi:endo-1,4-beta-xylanase
VNESLAPDGTLAENIFFKKLGPSYIEQCFRWAHEADPTAFLIYNDNKVEAMDGPNRNKSNGFFHLLKDLIDRGTPIHGAGMQAHFNAGGLEDRQRVPTPHQVKKQIRRIGELGLKVNISEMDVRISKLPENVRERAQTEIYHDILSAALSEPAFDGIWLWVSTGR